MQGQDVAAVDYKVTGERVSQDVGSLTSRQNQLCSVQGLVETVEAIREDAMQLEVPMDLLFQERVDCPWCSRRLSLAWLFFLLSTAIVSTLLIFANHRKTKAFGRTAKVAGMAWFATFIACALQ